MQIQIQVEMIKYKVFALQEITILSRIIVTFIVYMTRKSS